MNNLNIRNQINEAEIPEILKEIDSLPNEVRKKLHKTVEEICYDRTACRIKGIDYNNISNRDFVILLIEEYKRMKLEQLEQQKNEYKA